MSTNRQKEDYNLIKWEDVWDERGLDEYRSSVAARFENYRSVRNYFYGQERRWPFVGLRMTGEEVRLLRDAIPAPIKLFTQHEHIELSCPHCAEGTEVHDHQPPDQLVYGKLIAPEATALADVRDSWEGAQKRHGLVFALPGLYEALGDSKQAGQAHQAWGGIERRAAKRVGR